ncbi:hypothetical protein VIBNISOn1_1840050 [Vibrio nigripulchritudo SOn1]|uniref:Head processing protein n=1 Tax=Vibrio nigripulchritudo SOn1 TaxID=1238450 RepID=A0AAV2VPS4_9VIBR|nr:hypothetical protein [Vibrio nigripulchritudo]CCO46667.1 hypothetical protein VIBNISOn1_1840050 [Vibrio nigripulchritudo SOn1]
MSKKILQSITCTFNIFDTGRKYTGKQRGYILDNVKSVLTAPEVEERLRLRELVGYVSHGLREMAGKLTLGETLPVHLPNGQMTVVNAIPACVTVALSIDDEGNLTHTQEVLDNEEGRKLLGLHTSRIGGFSWACGGGKVGGNTLINGFFGFDYVHNPLFTGNRGYVLDSESAQDEFGRQAVLDNLTSAGVPEDARELVLDSFNASMAFESSQFKEQLLDAQLVIADQDEKAQELQQIVDSAAQENELLKSEKTNREQFFNQLQERSHVAISDQVLDALIKADSEEGMEVIIQMIMDTANIKPQHLPVAGHKKTLVQQSSEVSDKNDPFGINASMDAGYYD